MNRASTSTSSSTTLALPSNHPRSSSRTISSARHSNLPPPQHPHHHHPPRELWPLFYYSSTSIFTCLPLQTRIQRGAFLLDHCTENKSSAGQGHAPSLHQLARHRLSKQQRRDRLHLEPAKGKGRKGLHDLPSARATDRSICTEGCWATAMGHILWPVKGHGWEITTRWM